MAIKSSRFHNGRSGSALTIKVIPQSKVNKLTKILEDGTLMIKLKASQTGGEANIALINYLEKTLVVPKNQIEIIAGEDGAEKLIAILDVDPDEIQRRIMNNLLNL